MVLNPVSVTKLKTYLRMKTLGITGGIGSGKSTVAKVFMQLGIPVFFADIEAAKLIIQNKNLQNKIIKNFGEEIHWDGIIDRKKLAKIVFADKNKLEILNNIVHPAVKASFERWTKNNSNSPYIIKEAAILFEAGSDKGLDKIITVVAPAELRIKRVMKRDNVSKKDVEKRMKNQWSDEKKIKLSDFVITNDDKQLVIPQVLEIHKKIMAL